jgi:galactokinase
VVPSIILWIVCIAMGIMFIEVEVNPTTDKASALSSSAALRWAMAVFAITAFQNTLTSGAA